MTAEEAAWIMMSGGGKSGDKRVKMLDELESLCRIDIGDGWNVRIKVSADIDSSMYFQFGSTHGGIVNYLTFWALYYCVYQNDVFKYAACQKPFYTKHQENYQNADVPDRLYFISESSDFQVSSAEASYSSGNSFLNIKVRGTYSKKRTNYSWNSSGERIEEGTENDTYPFESSANDFNGSPYGGSYIVNGNEENLKNAVCELYSVCREKAANS